MAVARPLTLLFAFSLSLISIGCEPAGIDMAVSTVDETLDSQGVLLQPTTDPGWLTPQTSSRTTQFATPTSEPPSFELVRLRQYLRETQSSLLEIHQSVQDSGPEHRPLLEQALINMVDEMASLGASLEQVAAGMTPADREAAVGAMQRLQADLQLMQEPSPLSSPPPTSRRPLATLTPLPDTKPTMAELVQLLEKTRRQTVANLGQRDPEQIQALVGSMADVVGDLAELVSYADTAFNALDTQQQESIAGQAEKLYEVAQETKWELARVIPVRTATPTRPTP